MEKIKNVSINRRYNSPLKWATEGVNGHIEITAEFVIPLPNALSSLVNVEPLAKTYLEMFRIKEVVGNNAIFSFGPESMPLFRQDANKEDIIVMVNGNPEKVMIDHTAIRALLETEYADYAAKLGAFMPMPFDQAVGESLNGVVWEFIPPPPPINP